MLISQTGSSADRHFYDHSQSKKPRVMKFDRKVIQYGFSKFWNFEHDQTILIFFLCWEDQRHHEYVAYKKTPRSGSGGLESESVATGILVCIYVYKKWSCDFCTIIAVCQSSSRDIHYCTRLLQAAECFDEHMRLSNHPRKSMDRPTRIIRQLTYSLRSKKDTCSGLGWNA